MLGSPYNLYLFAAGEVVSYLAVAWMIVAFRIRNHSWRLLRRYCLLVPVFGAYLFYLVCPVGFSTDAIVRAYLCVLLSTATGSQWSWQ